MKDTLNILILIAILFFGMAMMTRINYLQDRVDALDEAVFPSPAINQTFQ